MREIFYKKKVNQHFNTKSLKGATLKYESFNKNMKLNHLIVTGNSNKLLGRHLLFLA